MIRLRRVFVGLLHNYFLLLLTPHRFLAKSILKCEAS